MVELKKSPDFPDIFKLKKCCYLAVQVDTFNRSPGVSQCYNCNLFNRSSKICQLHTRCLKCGEPHRTNDCPIKEKIANPICINCNKPGWSVAKSPRVAEQCDVNIKSINQASNKPGHMANWSQCEEFPKIKKKQSESTLNRNM
ncbi:putative RNA-directed DNA polymerase from transposon BS [Trichonephila clavipes]|nr:putative RNA-directed DNA polymerase from transposon BS [Trichonephila clavipes]